MGRLKPGSIVLWTCPYPEPLPWKKFLIASRIRTSEIIVYTTVPSPSSILQRSDEGLIYLKDTHVVLNRHLQAGWDALQDKVQDLKRLGVSA